ncbi:uracil-DNA glycosylase family protein [Streptobacillus moniliformis]|uniref:uracil-DNA glycosylase family protein n=1 Tax=Streptobacillus moniliformis TaxID=34105 RepID=UPI0007E45BC9|nr:uracil-DNA glycosylase [Streptobacillus moniliformis]
MELILKDSFNFNFSISDFALDPLNHTLITTGDSLNFLSNMKKIKSIKGKMKESLSIRFIKYENQLFQSNDFYVICSNDKVYKVDGKRKKIVEEITLPLNNVENIIVSKTGKLAYISNGILYINDMNLENLKVFPLTELGEGRFKVYISDENILIKHRKMYESTVNVLLFSLQHLKKIFEITSTTNHIYSKIVGLNYLSSTDEGYIEVWDILESQIKYSFKLSNYKITYIENDKNFYYFGNINGELIVTDLELNVVNKVKIFQDEIKKIKIFNSKIYILSFNNRMKVFDIINNESAFDNIVNDFMQKYNIHESYKEFFNIDRVVKIKGFIDNLEADNIEYTPSSEKIFKAFNQNISDIKVCIMGKDPYFQKGVATGLAFEVNSESWMDEKVNTSLKNILKLIYKTYTGNMADISEIRNKILKKEFNILAPNMIFENWQKQGVLLLNSSLTTIVDKAGAHHKFWESIINDLVEYISKKNINITYLLWGNDAAIMEKHILNGEIIKHNHPAICGNLKNQNDFMLGKSFEKTKKYINWLGE